YRSPRRSSRRTVSAIFCPATHCPGWRVLPFMDFYDQTDRLGSYRSRTAPAADIAAATRPVVDNKLLAEPLRQPLTHQARRDVGRAARRGGMKFLTRSICFSVKGRSSVL